MPRDRSRSIHRGEPINLTVDQRPVQAFAGETLATALLAQGISTFNHTASGQPRGPYCNMGTCFECQVRISSPSDTDFRWVRACMVTVREGMFVNTGATLLGQPPIPAEPLGESDESGN